MEVEEEDSEDMVSDSSEIDMFAVSEEDVTITDSEKMPKARSRRPKPKNGGSRPGKKFIIRRIFK